ncbi:tetratricopeptide repeat protein [Candidatus Obscuribacterales bacterium]|nr:tetratricopeptide repeat protein [Candidatus Obscuribacterales bacterium]
MQISTRLLAITTLTSLVLGLFGSYCASDWMFGNGLKATAAAEPVHALKNYDIAIALNPFNAPAWLNRGASRAATGDLSGAASDYERALNLGGSPEFLAIGHLNRSSLRKSQNDLDGALADLNDAIELNSSDWSAHHERGLLLAEVGDKTGAIADFTEAIRLNPNSESFAARGYELDYLDDSGALSDYNQALALDPKNVSALYGSAYAKLRLGDKAGAIAALKELVKLETPCAAQLRKLLNSFSARNFVGEPSRRGVSCGTDVA